MEDDEDEGSWDGTFRCDACEGELTEEDVDESTGWYTCPHCGHSNAGD